MIFLDTSVLVDYLRGKTDAVEFIEKQGKAHFVVNSLVVMELFMGARNKQELRKIKKELNGFAMLSLNQEIMDLATQIIGSYGLAFGISIPDAIIAATVLMYDLELRTLNVKDFRAIPGLKINL